jgi:hypothetical protein
MIHPDTRLAEINSTVGIGLVATADIPKGTITWCRDELDLVLTRKQVRSLAADVRRVYLKYAYCNDAGELVLNWDNGRYQNHSCSPTSCLIPGLDAEIAIRDIRAGEQLSADYATYNIGKGFACACGSPDCRSTVDPSDKPARLQDLGIAISEALQQRDLVEQPLMPAFTALQASRSAEQGTAERQPVLNRLGARVRRLFSKGRPG